MTSTSNISNLTITKAVIECKFPKALLFNDLSKLTTIHRNLKELFSQYDYNKESQVFTLFNPQLKITGQLKDQRITYEINEPRTINGLKSNACKFIEMAFNILEVDEIERIGVRIFWALAQSTLEEASEAIGRSFYKLDDEQINAFGSKIVTYRVSLSSILTDDFKANINIIPRKFTVLEIADGATIRNESGNQIVIDLDIFTDTKKTPKSVNSVIREAVTQAEQRAYKICKLVMGD